MSTVLVIEDDISLRALVSLVLEMHGYRVQTAENGLDGLDHIAATMPDLILLDMRMPVMSGAEFAAEYQARYRDTTRAPIIVVTAAEHAARKAQEVGANGFLAKPFSNTELVRAVEKHVGATVAAVTPS
ncbi:MAG: response regulator [Kofleriaceae bacterium]|nr:response regulator [Kofleriaceae bacterium]